MLRFIFILSNIYLTNELLLVINQNIVGDFMTKSSNQNKEAFPSVQINGHYIRELSFDNKHAPASFLPQQEAPKTEVAVNFNHRNVQDNVY